MPSTPSAQWAARPAAASRPRRSAPRARERVGQERLGDVQDSVEVHVHHPIDLGEFEILDPGEALDDARDVDDAIDGLVRRRDCGEQRLDGRAIREVDDVRGDSVRGGARQSYGLREPRSIDAQRGDACAPTA